MKLPSTLTTRPKLVVGSVLVAGTLTVGGLAAAAAGSLPDVAQGWVHDALAHAVVTLPDAPDNPGPAVVRGPATPTAEADNEGTEVDDEGTESTEVDNEGTEGTENEGTEAENEGTEATQPDNHGSEVRAVAQDPSLEGADKGAAVCAVASGDRCMPEAPGGADHAPDVTMPSLPVTIPVDPPVGNPPAHIPPVTIPDAPGAVPVGR